MSQFITRLLEPKDNAPESAFLLAKLLDAKISKSTFDKEIKEHPDYPSFLSISDVLTNFEIENITAKFPKEKIFELPVPFITQVTGDKEILQFTVVKEINRESVFFYDPEIQLWNKTSLLSFLQKCSGIVLLAEAEGPIKEKGYERKIRDEKRIRFSRILMFCCIPLFLLLSAWLALADFGLKAILPITFSVLTLTGTLITILLLWYEVDQRNAALQQICMAGKKTNCGAILQSKDARIFGISWSSIGFVYFAGGLLSLLFSGLLNSNTLAILAFFNLAAVPYVFYSIYYQWKIAKQWCILCLSVQAVLVFQLVVILIAGWVSIPSLQDNEIFGVLVRMLTAFAIPFIVVSLLVPALRKANENSRLVAELQRLKHSPEIFDAVLQKQKSVEYDPHGLGITIGNPNGTTKIIKVCNPYCGPCARAHTPMEDLLNNNPELQLQIIFNATSDHKDIRSHPVRHLLAIDEKLNGQMTKQALEDWYLTEKKDYEIFSKKYPMNGDLKKQDYKIDAMKEWCTKTDIQFTPTFFVNGYQLPVSYTVNDLKYFLST